MSLLTDATALPVELIARNTACYDYKRWLTCKKGYLEELRFVIV